MPTERAYDEDPKTSVSRMTPYTADRIGLDYSTGRHVRLIKHTTRNEHWGQYFLGHKDGKLLTAKPPQKAAIEIMKEKAAEVVEQRAIASSGDTLSLWNEFSAGTAQSVIVDRIGQFINQKDRAQGRVGKTKLRKWKKTARG